ncbi:uncharacterized protein LOC141852782 [Brevipalpus obovatus]|uniref:uncharacterized protein LOC141852782 n=1 Tax=Brevipalpus obovatus TaxID=246614 RepID=UPI003D9EA107
MGYLIIGLMFITSLMKLNEILAIRLKGFGVPGTVANGSSVWLHCDFDLEGDSLYSVKWYKNNEEFYGLLNDNSKPDPIHRVHPQRGIHIDLKRSNTTHVFLMWTDLNTEGTFGCEVSTVNSFQTIKAVKDMRIYVPPKTRIAMYGRKERYNLGDTLNLTCIAGPSKPPVLLTWFINDKQDIVHSTSFISEKDGLSISRANIIFPLTMDLIMGDELMIRCESLFLSIYGVAFKEIQIEEKAYYSGLYNSDTYSSNGDPNGMIANGKEAATIENVYEYFEYSSEHTIRPPEIHGYASRYQIGDTVNLNCSSYPAHPPAFIEWFVNDREALKTELVFISNTNEQSDGTTSSMYDNFAVFDDNIPKSSILGLKVKILKEHYQTSDGIMRLRCKATYAKIISRDASNLRISGNGKQSSQLYASHSITSGSASILELMSIHLILAGLGSIFLNGYGFGSYLSISMQAVDNKK